jgi:serine/threonine-protein kinase
MSPEQLRREALDVRTDLWSLGIVLYELMSGAPPFGGAFPDLVRAILHGAAVPLHERNPAVPAGLSAVVQRCLARDPKARWFSAGDLARALAPFGPERGQAMVDRVTRALANAKDIDDPRRYSTFENALFALDAPVINEVTTEPPVDQEEAMAFSETIPAPSSKKMRLAILDHSQVTLRVQADLLSKAGFDVRTTTDAADLDRIIDQWRPQLVILEAEITLEDGKHLCRHLKSKHKATLPVVITSNMPQGQLADRAKSDGADASFHKSNDGAALVAFIKNIFAMTYSPEDVP